MHAHMRARMSMFSPCPCPFPRAQALAANGCALLHMVASEDRVVPLAQSHKVAKMWDAPLVTVGGQGHQFGDAGWQESTMGPLREFLDALA